MKEFFLNGFYILGENQKTTSTDQVVLSTDLLCEGPIQGLVDSDGSTLKFLKNKSLSDVGLGKGIYYNDVPLIDSELNKFNYISKGYEITDGSNNADFWDYPSTVFRYNSPLGLSNINANVHLSTINSLGHCVVFDGTEEGSFSFAGAKDSQQFYSAIADYDQYNWLAGNLPAQGYVYGMYRDDLTYPVGLKPFDVGNRLINFKGNAPVFSHKIKNKNIDEITVNFNANQLFTMKNNGDTLADNLDFCIELTQDNNTIRYFIHVPVFLVSKGNKLIPVKINVDLDDSSPNDYYVNIFMLAKTVALKDGRTQRSAILDSVVETVRRKGKFNYPYGVVCKSMLSSSHFKSDPTRSFDIKGLKVKVPSNYDPDSKQYYGNWDGTFSKFLQWTDNPAWIYYDICTNQRYGVGNGNVLSEDLNKWELYKIAKYCDELIESTSPKRYEADDFIYYPQIRDSIFISKVSSSGVENTIHSMREKYKPLNSGNANKIRNSDNENNSGWDIVNSIVYLYDIDKGGHGAVKKVLYSVTEGDVIESADGTPTFQEAETEGAGGSFRLHCGKDFSPSWFFQNEENGRGLSNFKEVITPHGDISNEKNSYKYVKQQIAFANANTELGAKTILLAYIYHNWWAEGNDWIKRTLIIDSLFEGQSGQTILRGKCMPKAENFREPLEPRFTANLYIDNETEVLKLINDIASIFRGLTYYRNNLITTTIDVSKPISYIFNNSNVKEGLFSYSTGSIDGNYSVAKVLYKDKYKNFSDEVEIIEDAELVKEFGIVSKEILGFGATSRDQARRMGLWLLSTNRFENETVSFTTDIQGLLLKPGDVVQVQDSFKSLFTLHGRVVDINLDQTDANKNYIIIDRKINIRFAGEKIKFLFNNVRKNYKAITDSSQYEENENYDVMELVIDRIENKGNKIYFKGIQGDSLADNVNFINFSKLAVATPFIIQGDSLSSKIQEERTLISENDLDYERENENLYKIISINEEDVNEYSIFCVKYDRNKYLSLDKNVIQVKTEASKEKISYSTSENIVELDLSGMGDDYYEVIRVDFKKLSSLNFDYQFCKEENFMDFSESANYAYINLKFSEIYNYVNNQSDSGSTYYNKVLNILEKNGGFVCKVQSENQSIRFKVPYVNMENKSIFLGKYPNSVDTLGLISFKSDVKIYLYDDQNKIIEV